MKGGSGGGGGGDGGFVRADQIDLKSLDEQLERHLSRAWTMEKRKEEAAGADQRGGGRQPRRTQQRREDWEIDPAKLVVKGVIARGTFGTVHRGIYDGHDVAVKLVDWGEDGHRSEQDIQTLRAAFSQEVSVWHKLDHPNVTKFIGAIMGARDLNIQTENGHIGMPTNICCVVVEYLAGGALKSFLIKNRRRKLAFKVVVQIALDLARGLSYLHSKKIVHRDVKTENMLLDKTRTVKIADFGVARLEASNPSDMTGETGTLGYMAPEVLNGNPYNRKCDVYSFGICLWEIYCCDMPYPDLSFSEVTSAVVRQNLRPEIPRCCPSSLANVMKRCWDVNPDKRPEMAEVVSMLEAIDTSKGGGMIPVDQRPGCLSCFRARRDHSRSNFWSAHLTKPRRRLRPPDAAAAMAPAVGLKRSATQTITLPPLDARLAVRDVMRSTIPSPPAEAPAATERAAPAAPSAAVEGFLCLEEVDGRRWSYVVDGGAGKGRGGGGATIPAGPSVRAVPLQSPLPPAEEIMAFIRSYVVPEGFPDSVTPSYVPYMTWRALKHFFGGAMGVFTTRTLLSSVGVSQSKVTPGAIAINWILKDGAGRVGKMLFARQGKKFDYDLKQLRFSSDLLLEIGAGIELTTAAFPQFFLPMACVANVVKNVAAVTSTSTRTPIYKAYARGENIGDVTAKGESVGNIADLLGTGLSIFISKRNPSLVTSFAFLSCGYLLSSYHEVRSVVLNTLNRARFTVAVDSFIKTGSIPSLKEGNSQETIFNPPWRHEPIAIGSRFGEAFQEPASFVAIRPLFEDERYIVTYNPTKDKVYALLKDQAKSDDILKAAFHAHVLLHFINASHARRLKQKHVNPNRSDNLYSRNMDFLAHIAESCKIVSSSYGTFKKKAREQGWIMSESLLNPGKARLCGTRPQ